MCWAQFCTVQTGPRNQSWAWNPVPNVAPSYRLARILVRLPALRLMSANITEELFFTGLIGNVSIDSIIPYILKMETAEYNGQITGASL